MLLSGPWTAWSFVCSFGLLASAFRRRLRIPKEENVYPPARSLIAAAGPLYRADRRHRQPDHRQRRPDGTHEGGRRQPRRPAGDRDAGRLYRPSRKTCSPTRSDELDRQVPPALREPEGHWFGLSVHGRVIVYAPTGDPANLSTYEALATSNGRTASASAPTTSTTSPVASLIAHDGEAATSNGRGPGGQGPGSGGRRPRPDQRWPPANATWRW